MSKEWEPEDIFDVLASETARKILVLAKDRSMSAQELADHCNKALPTVYRRINVLVDYDLLTEDMEVDPEGNHYKTFRTNLESINFSVNQDGFEISTELRRDLVDRFGEFWSDLGGPEPDAQDK